MRRLFDGRTSSTVVPGARCQGTRHHPCIIHRLQCGCGGHRSVDLDTCIEKNILGGTSSIDDSTVNCEPMRGWQESRRAVAEGKRKSARQSLWRLRGLMSRGSSAHSSRRYTPSPWRMRDPSSWGKHIVPCGTR
jgi:hypothetical protein